MNLKLPHLATASLLLLTPVHAALVIKSDTDETDWLLQTSESAGSLTFEGNTVTSTVINAGFTRGVVGPPAYGFVERSVGGAGAEAPATVTGTWTFTNLAAGSYDVVATFRARGASSVRYTVNGGEVFVDQSGQPDANEGPSFTEDYNGGRTGTFNFTTIGSALNITEGGSITVTIDNSNTASTISMDTVGIRLVPEPGAPILGALGVLLLLRRRR